MGSHIESPREGDGEPRKGLEWGGKWQWGGGLEEVNYPQALAPRVKTLKPEFWGSKPDSDCPVTSLAELSFPSANWVPTLP